MTYTVYVRYRYSCIISINVISSSKLCIVCDDFEAMPVSSLCQHCNRFQNYHSRDYINRQNKENIFYTFKKHPYLKNIYFNKEGRTEDKRGLVTFTESRE